MLRYLTLFLVLTGITACAGVRVDNYASFEPAFAAESFFNGLLTAHGVIKNRGGEVIRTFNADIEASWQDGVGTLKEDFVFNDGEEQQRIWTLTPDGNGSYIGSAGDVVGTTQPGSTSPETACL